MYVHGIKACMHLYISSTLIYKSLICNDVRVQMYMLLFYMYIHFYLMTLYVGECVCLV